MLIFYLLLGLTTFVLLFALVAGVERMAPGGPREVE
jgi:hypothetical protein